MSRPFELALRLFLVAQLLDPPLPWLERLPVLTLAGAGLVLPGLLRSRALWSALLLTLAVPLAWNWPFPDNHDYLTALFCLAVICALSTPLPERTLAWNARMLIGLAFAFATVWKLLLAPDFLDGRFFRVTLLHDGRFENLAVLLTDVTWEEWDENALALDAVLAGEVEAGTGDFSEPAGIRPLAALLTGATLAIEGLVALSFLWPPGGRISRWRDPTLLLFSALTYSFATVRGFGWLLVAMGVAQCEPRRRVVLAYLVLFVLIGAYRAVPWTRWLIEGMGLG
jgi:hypothetical protein